MYALVDDDIVVVQSESRATTADPDELLGAWYWLAFEDSADGAESNDIIVADPAKYSLEFLPDGSVAIQADCNSAGGPVAIDGSSLSFGPLATTLAQCEPGSLYDVYLARLDDAVTFVFDEEGNLVLNLMMDAGNMIFTREAIARGVGLLPDIAAVDLDTQGLYPDWQAVVVPEQPYDQSMPPGPVGLPAHIQILFGVNNHAAYEPGDPIIYIIPVNAYRDMWEAAGNMAVTNMLARIADQTGGPAVSGTMAALPLERTVGRNDLAVQIGRPTPSDNGYRFVGRWMQDANPVTNQHLVYVYQGLTSDGRYLIAFFHPVATDLLPANPDAVAQAEFDRLLNDYAAYMAEQTELLTGLDSADFAPTLEALDALVASLTIAP